MAVPINELTSELVNTLTFLQVNLLLSNRIEFRKRG